MTRQKTLKALVRNRMARTGETYTTARRHVLAQRTDLSPFPTAVLPGYTATGGGTHPPSTLLRNLLAHRGVSFSEAMLAGLGGGIGFLYAVFEYKDFPYPTMTVVAQHHPEPFLPAALARLGFTTSVTTTSSAKVAARRLAETLAGGAAAVCTLDRAALPWHGVVDPVFGDPHDVAVIGADDDTVYLDDGCVRPNPLPRRDFDSAWARKHRLLTISDAGAFDLPTAIRDAVATTMGHMTGPVLGHAYDANFGLSGMSRLVDALGDRKGRKGWSNLFGRPDGFFWALRRLHDCLELEYTAPGATRPLYADFLTEAALDDTYSEAAAMYRTSGVHWSALAAQALAAAPELARYDDLAERKLTLMVTEGARASAEIQAVSAEMAALPAEYAAGTPLSPAEQDAVFDALSERAAAVLAVERQAVAVLARRSANSLS
ncbi:protein of unknown function [Actinokineospora alba]|uniref:Butirosin biosynthesis protein H, N-terminal n=1 Tax=Actinokineospora alba TaxID=504798 RepID=A0A1H0IEA8_9PSEU|nr:BtrH N-terminal domain-containing protein [Actinokineospora alba]TDP70977.1 uncharacterized protein DUF4872 [Actinokineospora alba]SDI88716.1 protein of unknown function [Actinokineospora alba]SDO29777.1 protein of unknown function [Actinokineospora alba]